MIRLSLIHKIPLKDLEEYWDARDLATLFDIFDDLAEEQRLNEPAPPVGQVRTY